jgi:phage gp46-like protein
MSFNKYEGDVKVIITEDGADMIFRGGQPLMDQGLENASQIPWFTRNGWVGNLFLRDANQQVGSDFEEKAQGTVTVSKLIEIQKEGEAAWQKLIDSGLASRVIVRASNPSGSQTQVAGLIQPPGRDLEILLATKNGANWIAQKENPAHERIY